MKSFKVLLMVWTCSSAAMAQDYYSPTDQAKEAVARFPLQEIKIKTNSTGKKYITYTLPLELTGEVNTIVAEEVDVPHLEGVKHDIRIFSDPQKATITCLGTDDRPGCMVQHQNLRFDRARAITAIERTHFDPRLREDAKIVMDDFQSTAHSGNQPIGVLGGLKPRPDSLPEFPTGTLQTQYDFNAKVTKVDITWLGKNAAKYSAIDGTLNGKLTDMVYSGNRVSGRWSVNGSQSKGWFEFVFNSTKTRFDGYFGFGDHNASNSARAGVWRTL